MGVADKEELARLEAELAQRKGDGRRTLTAASQRFDALSYALETKKLQDRVAALKLTVTRGSAS